MASAFEPGAARPARAGWSAVLAALASALVATAAFATAALADDAAPAPQAVTAAAPAAKAPPGGVIGLVLVKRYIAVYQTPGGKEECPDGLQHTNAENYKQQFPTEAERLAWEARFSYPTNRGPHGENIFYFPRTAKDALPFRGPVGKTAIGLNLDGRIGPNDFTSPTGEPGIDNQLYRVVGCIGGLRNKGVIAEVTNRELRVSPFNRILLEITGVDDLQNDDDVEVTTWRGLDPLVEDLGRNVIGGTTQRVDLKFGQRFIHHMKGRIVDGVLITEPKTVVLPSQQAGGTFTEQTIRDMRLRLNLTAKGAEGLMGGYLDAEEWWFEFSRTWGAGQVADITGWSPNATYEALHRFADAYPDPKTGANTAISAAYTLTFAPVFIVHPQSGAKLAAAASR